MDLLNRRWSSGEQRVAAETANSISDDSKSSKGEFYMSRCTWVNRVVLSASFLILTFLTVGAHAQYRASIQGVVTDPQGAVIPDAKVTLTNLETNRSQA